MEKRSQPTRFPDPDTLTFYFDFNMNYFKQIYYEMKHQKMMTWVSVSGTALAIFLVMALVMSEQVNTVDVAPETDRSRIMEGKGIHVQTDGGRDGSGFGLAYDAIQKLYGNLDGVECLSHIYEFSSAKAVGLPGQETITMLPIIADADYFKVYDFKFIDGRPFEKAEEGGSEKLVVLTRSAARAIFGEEKVAGREIEENFYPIRVVGVVEDVNPLLGSYANYYKLYDPKSIKDNDPFFGESHVVLKLKPGVDPEHVKSQVEKRYDLLQAEASKYNQKVIYHGQPYTMAEVGLGGFGSNNGPDMEGHRKMNWVIYTVLILLPAINLSSMTRGRLRHRVSEIGVRRAFGARRNSIIRQIFGENLIITLLGGLIGFVLSLIFLVLASHLFFNFSGELDPSSLTVVNARPDLSMLFRWDNFLWALLFCFILNILSATVPAWRASKVEPAVAIASSHQA